MCAAAARSPTHPPPLFFSLSLSLIPASSQVYIADALGQRVWCSLDETKVFVRNIETVFGPPAIAKPAVVKAPVAAPEDDWEEEEMVVSETSQAVADAGAASGDKRSADGARAQGNEDDDVRPRFVEAITRQAEQWVVGSIKDTMAQAARNNQGDPHRNVIRMMIVAASVRDVRVLASKHVQTYVNQMNGGQLVMDLLVAITGYCKDLSVASKEIVGNCTRVRFPLKAEKSIKPFLDCIERLMNANKSYAFEALQAVVRYELHMDPNHPAYKFHPTLSGVMGFCLKLGGGKISEVLGMISQDTLAEPGDRRVQLRSILRRTAELPNFDVLNFTQGLSRFRPGKFSNLSTKDRECLVAHISEFGTLGALCQVSRDAVDAAKASAADPSAPRLPPALLAAKGKVATAQTAMMHWLHKQVAHFVAAPSKLYIYALRNILFLQSAAAYIGQQEDLLPEHDQLRLRAVRGDIILSEGVISHLTLMGTSEHNIPEPEALAMLCEMVRRAARPQLLGEKSLVVNDAQLIETVLKLVLYPVTARLPEGYTPPTLGYTKMYWQAWNMLVILCAANPKTLGAAGWERYPTLQHMMEMCIMNSRTQQTSPAADSGKDARFQPNTATEERQIAAVEKDEILQLESRIAQAFNQPIPTEATCKRLSQLCRFDPHGRCRVLPREALDQMVRHNTEFGIGIALCKSRGPDFLRKVMMQSGVERAMEWLTPLVNKVPDTFKVLPTQALAELYFCNTASERSRKPLVQKLWSDDAVEVVKFFAAKLYSVSSAARRKARLAFSSLFNPASASSSEGASTTGKWLLEDLPNLPTFNKWKGLLCTEVMKAVGVATDLQDLRFFIRFVCQHASADRSLSVLQDVSKLLGSRRLARRCVLKDGTCSVLLLKLYKSYMSSAKGAAASQQAGATQNVVNVVYQGNALRLPQAVLNGLLYVVSATVALPHARATAEELIAGLTTAQDSFVAIGKHVRATGEASLTTLMLQSTSAQLVACVLNRASTGILITIIQYFGIPSAITAQIFAQLDKKVDKDAQSFRQKAEPFAGQLRQKLCLLRKLRFLEGKNVEAVLKAPKPSAAKADNAAGHAAVPPTAVRHADAMDVSPATLAWTSELAFGTLSRMFESNDADTSKFRQLMNSLQLHSLGAGSPTGAIDARGLCGHVSAKLTPGSPSYSLAFLRGIVSRCRLACPLLQLLCTIERLRGTSTPAAEDGHPAFPLHAALATLLHERCGMYAELRSSTNVFQGLLLHCHAFVSTGRGGGTAPLPDAPGADVTLARLQAVANDGAPGSTAPSFIVHSFLMGNQRDATSAASVRDIFTIAQTLRCPLVEPLVDFCVGSRAAMAQTERRGLLGSLLDASFDAKQRAAPSSPQRGLLLDWIVLLDPEMLFTPDTDHCLPMFQRPKEDAALLRVALSHFIETATWPTLRAHVQGILEGAPATNHTNPSLVLDFTLSCVKHPRLWLGSQDIGKGQTVASLTAPEYVQLVLHIIRETVAYAEEHSKELASPFLRARLAVLLVNATPGQHGSIIRGVETLTAGDILPGVAAAAGADSTALADGFYAQVLSELYLASPRISRGKMLRARPRAEASAHAQASTLDIVIHKLVIALLGVRPEESAMFALQEDRALTAYRIFRNLAVEHPARVLQSLPTISALIAGLAELGRADFIRDKADVVFAHYLGIMEALRPHIFAPCHGDALADALGPFWQLLERTIDMNIARLVGVLDKFVKFLFSLYAADATRARALLQPRCELLKGVHGNYPETEVAALVDALEDPSPVAVVRPVRFTDGHIAQMRDEFRCSWGENASHAREARALTSLDRASMYEPDLLKSFSDEISLLLGSSDAQCRDLAYRLLFRYMKYAPTAAEGFSPVFFKCLGSGNLNISRTALQHVSVRLRTTSLALWPDRVFWPTPFLAHTAAAATYWTGPATPWRAAPLACSLHRRACSLF